MARLLLLLFLFLSVNALAQFSDMISVRKKNGSNIKTFYAGSPIVLQTTTGAYVEGRISDIRHDSIFIATYDIRTVMSQLGVWVVDTVAKYELGLHYTEIERIKVFTYHRFLRGKIDKLLTIGGAGYFALNVLNHATHGQSLTGAGNGKSLAISAGAFGLGFVINKLFGVNHFSRKKHKIVYVHIK